MHRIYTMSFGSVYPLYITKAERKARTIAEVDEIICWLMGYSQKGLEAQLKKETNVETFIAEAPRLNPSRTLIKGVIRGFDWKIFYGNRESFYCLCDIL